MKKLLVLFGIGVAVKYFLDSESGKDMKKQVQNWLNEAQDALSGSLKNAGKTVDDIKIG